MQIKPKRAKYTFLKGFIYFEISLFLGSYFIWKRMNNSQDFRYYMKNQFPFVLESYYQIGEKIGGVKTREYDLECWKDKK